MDPRAVVDERIKTLLTSTDLTFKQIIEQLKGENIPASFNTIRRVNRNNIFRKPRYDAKLTPQQRKQLLVILKKTVKPNLSALARHFGVCHGSIWYWWDKLTKLREKHNGIIPNNELSLEMDNDLVQPDFGGQTAGSLPKSRLKHRLTAADADEYGFDVITYFDYDRLVDLESDPLDLSGEDGDNGSDTSDNGSGAHNDPPCETQYWPDDGDEKHDNPQIEDQHENSIMDHHELIGPVKAKDTSGQYINLPILMYAPISFSSPSTSSTSH